MIKKDNESKDVLEIIKRYLNGKLEGRELKDFKRLLDLDPDFYNQVQEIKLDYSTRKNKSTTKKFNVDDKPVTTIKNKTFSKQNLRYSNYSKCFGIAAFIIAVGGIWFFSTAPNEKLYKKYFKPDAGLPYNVQNNKNMEFHAAMISYQQGEYERAIKKWVRLRKIQPENDTLNYFIGVAQLANKNEALALPYLEHAVTANNNFKFLDNAYYYLGLAYLKQGNYKKAIDMISKCTSKKSKLLLEQLQQ